ncbi:hypothetical protein Tco_0999981, partial [Tanacetum coccineum]
EEGMLVSSSNHWLMVMWRRGLGNGSSSGCHGGLWWLIMNEEDDEVVVVGDGVLAREALSSSSSSPWSENDILGSDGAVQIDTFKLKKSTDIVGSRKIVHYMWVVMDIQEKDKNRSQIDKTEHENGKSVKEKSKSNQVKVNPGKWIWK